MNANQRERLEVISALLLEAFAAADATEHSDCACFLCGKEPSEDKHVYVRERQIVGRIVPVCNGCISVYGHMVHCNQWNTFHSRSADAFENQDPINIAKWLALRISKASTVKRINPTH